MYTGFSRKVEFESGVLVWRLAVGVRPSGDSKEIVGSWTWWCLAEGKVMSGDSDGNNSPRACPPGGVDCSARRWLQNGWLLGAWRLAVRVPRMAVWELLAPSGMCPPLGYLAVVSPSSWIFLGVIYKSFGDASKVRLLGSLS